jgi:hypothetical protein
MLVGVLANVQMMLGFNWISVGARADADAESHSDTNGTRGRQGQMWEDGTAKGVSGTTRHELRCDPRGVCCAEVLESCLLDDQTEVIELEQVIVKDGWEDVKEEEGPFKANAVNDEDPAPDRPSPVLEAEGKEHFLTLNMN